jgi:hypothetical protein
MSKPFRIDTEIAIAAPPERVWAILTDFAGYARWNPNVVQVLGSLEPGSELRLKSVHVPGQAATDGIVTLVGAVFPKMHWEGGHPDRSVLKGERLFRCEPEGSGCRFHQSELFSGMSAERLVLDFGARIEANFRLFNEALKRAAEELRAIHSG